MKMIFMVLVKRMMVLEVKIHGFFFFFFFSSFKEKIYILTS